MNTGKYYELKEALEDIKVNASTSYQGSLAYDCDINEVVNSLKELKDRYTNLNALLDNNNSVANNLEYDNMSYFINSTLNKVKPLVEGVDTLITTVKTKSESAYSELSSEYNTAFSVANSNLSKANTAMKLYETLSSKLNRMVSDDPHRDSIKKAKDAAEITFNLAISNARNAISKLEKVLKDGYKRM